MLVEADPHRLQLLLQQGPGRSPKAFTGAQGGPAPLSDEAQPSSTRCRPRVSTDLLPGAGQPQGTQASAGRSQSQDGTAPASRHKRLRDEAPGHLSWARPVHHLASAPTGGRATSPWTTEALRPRCPPAPRASGWQLRWLRHRPLRLSLGGVQHHDDHVRRASHCDHLSASAFPWSGGGGGHAVTRAGRCGAQTPVLIDLPWTLPHATPGWHVSRTPCCLAHGDVLQEETGLTTGEERCAPPTPRAGGEHPPTSAHSTRQAVPRSRCGPPAAHERHSGFAQTHRAVSSQHVTRLPLEISYRKEPGSQHRRRGCRR